MQKRNNKRVVILSVAFIVLVILVAGFLFFNKGITGNVINPPAGTLNYALPSNGGNASAANSLGSGFSPSGAVNGDRKGLNWGNGGGWNSANIADWFKVNFNATRTIREIDVFMIQDDWSNPSEPTEDMTFSSFGIIDFKLQYLSGGSWVDVPNGVIVGNDKVWVRISIPSGISTNQIRLTATKVGSSFIRIAEFETWGDIPFTCIENWSCSAWGSCIAGSQSRTCIDTSNCGTNINKPLSIQSCIVPVCVENWTCSNWSACTNNQQTKTCIDTSNCGTTTNRPTLIQACSISSCVENWTCSSFGVCTNGNQSKTCIDTSNCGTNTTRPLLTQSCILSISQQNCTDYEGIINYSVKGEILRGGVSFLDSCLNSTSLQELFCFAADIAVIRVNCELGCLDGRCLNQLVNSSINNITNISYNYSNYDYSDYNFSDYYADYNSSNYYDEYGNNYSDLTYNEGFGEAPLCVSDIKCTYDPEKCPSSGRQNKTCTDVNGCIAETYEEVECESSNSSFALFFIKVICKLTNLFNSENYQQCVMEYSSA